MSGRGRCRAHRPGRRGRRPARAAGTSSRRAEIRKVQQRVGREDAHRGDVREVVSLGHHLRPDQARGAPGLHVLDDGGRARGAERCPDRARRATTSGKSSAKRSATRSVPAPMASSTVPPHAGQRAGRGDAFAAVVADQRPSRLWTVRATLHCVHRKSWPQSRHSRNGANPRRGWSRIACSPRAKTSRRRSRRGAGEERHALLVGPGELPAQVDDGDLGQRTRGDALRELEERRRARGRRRAAPPARASPIRREEPPHSLWRAGPRPRARRNGETRAACRRRRAPRPR